jgi:hypothetical protein
MDKNQIVQVLKNLGDELDDLGQKKTIKLLIIGGAYMLTQIGNRDATTDIDGKVLEIKDPMNSQDYLVFKNATHFVANDNKLEYAWFSDNISDFLDIVGPLPQLTRWKKFGKLEVYIPPAEYILALKFIAGRRKDRDDIFALCKKLHIRTRRQAHDIMDAYVTNEDIKQEKNVTQTINGYFPN